MVIVLSKSKYMEVVGIDISKKSFDSWSVNNDHGQYSNDKRGFNELYKAYGDAHYVMESTSSYHCALALYLHTKGCSVSVVNPLPVKRFMQMRMQRLKTDKSDAKLLCAYGRAEKPALWEPAPEYVSEGKLLLSTIELLLRQRTALKNKLDNLQSGGMKSGPLIRVLKRQIKQLKKEVGQLEEELMSSLKMHAQHELTQLTSIPGVGPKTAAILLVYSNLFRDFEEYRQFIAYVGLCPVHRQSGTSIKGRSYISKKGSRIVRNHLFLCSFTACQHNPQCHALYTRLVAKGKSKKLALIAVSNKLIKQCFGVIKNNLMYDPQYESRLVHS